MTEHLHNYSVPLAGPSGPHSRCCEICGEPQVYRPPTGKGRDFPDALVDKADLRFLIDSYRGQAAMPCEVTDELCDRLELLLD